MKKHLIASWTLTPQVIWDILTDQSTQLWLYNVTQPIHELFSLGFSLASCFFSYLLFSRFISSLHQTTAPPINIPNTKVKRIKRERLAFTFNPNGQRSRSTGVLFLIPKTAKESAIKKVTNQYK